MFNKILIANRGEIACRIIRTAKRLNIKTVAVYSEIDANAMHVELADEAYFLGPPPATESYLDKQKILNIALQAKAEVIHPGYGFLSENADFANLCISSGIVFIGPSVNALQIMGNKTLAKDQMQKIGVPVTPGYQGEIELSKLKSIAENIGYPLLIKASAGGGGKGMRLVANGSELSEAIQSAQREALKSFGDASVFLEKYIEPVRHIEIQIFADSFGNVVHLYDRDCSIQRRHQKIIEEAPAPHLSDKLRVEMANAAIKAAKSIQYTGAGTIEFLVDTHEHFYFMEMNTRLQVEHPVTEMITGIDLVEWQLRVAAGEALPLTQEAIKQHGHAIEARICAEDPENNYLPSVGKIDLLVLPLTDNHTRIDSGVRQDDSISVYYDSMIAKLICHSAERKNTIIELKKQLENTFIVGVKTNVALLTAIMRDKKFIEGELSTQFLTRADAAFLSKQSHDEAKLAAFVTQIDLAISDGWRLNTNPQFTLILWENKHPFTLIAEKLHENVYRLTMQNKLFNVEVINKDRPIRNLKINNTNFIFNTFGINEHIHIFAGGNHYDFSLDNEHNAESLSGSDSQLISPMPGTISKLLVKPNEAVTKGQKLLILEAMKMEHVLLAPNDGIVKSIFYNPGDFIAEGIELLEFEST